MGVMGRRDERFVNLEKKVGMFVFAAAAGLLLVVLSVGVRQNLFTSKERVYFVADSGYGLSEGQPVKLSGFVIGSVKHIALDNVPMVRAEMSINREYMKWIKTDSRARLVEAEFVGGNFIDVTPGGRDKSPVEPGGELSFEREKGISETVRELKAELSAVLGETNSFLAFMNDPDGDVKASLRNVRELSDEMQVVARRLDVAIANMDGGITKTLTDSDELVVSLKGTAAKLDKTVADMDKVVAEADKAVSGAGEIVEGSKDDIRITLGNLRQVSDDVKSISARLPAVVERVDTTARDADELVGAAKKHWLIRSYVDAPPSGDIDADSMPGPQPSLKDGDR